MSQVQLYQLPICLVGGDAMQRTVLAIRIRRASIEVESELQNRKRAKAYAAAKATGGTVFDIDRREDQEELCWLLRAIAEGEQ